MLCLSYLISPLILNFIFSKFKLTSNLSYSYDLVAKSILFDCPNQSIVFKVTFFYYLNSFCFATIISFIHHSDRSVFDSCAVFMFLADFSIANFIAL